MKDTVSRIQEVYIAYLWGKNDSSSRKSNETRVENMQDKSNFLNIYV
jgi:hypothetical protein